MRIICSVRDWLSTAKESSRTKAMTFLEEIEIHPLCGDGAMGTLLQERGAAADECLEALCISRPDSSGKFMPTM